MILLLVFIALFLGLSWNGAHLVFSLVIILFLLFTYKRVNYLMTLVLSGVIAFGIAISFINISYQKTIYQGVIYEAKENYFLFNSGGERLYIYEKKHGHEIGDILKIEGEKRKLDFTVLESDFDFNDYLNRKGVFYSLEINEMKVVFSNPVRIRSYQEKFLSNFNETERSIIGAILFSKGEDSALRTTLDNLHLTRFLTATGLYIMGFVVLLNYVLKIFLKDKTSEAISTIVILVYSVITFPRLAIIRVAAIQVYKWINKYVLKQRFSYLEILSSLGIAFLLFDHYLARQDSFILGFSIPLVAYLIRDICPENKLKSSMVKTFAIYLLFLPFEAKFYYKINIFALPLQVLSTPLFMVISLTSIISLFGLPLTKLCSFLVACLTNYTKIIKHIGLAIFLPPLPDLFGLIYGVIYLGYLYYLSLGLRPFARAISYILCSLILVYSLPIGNALSSEVSFVNVGQGDCTIIRYKNKVSMVDTGGLTYKDIAQDVLVPYLHKKRIYTIENVFITHYDEDHYGALSGLQKQYKIKNIYDYQSIFPVKMGKLTFYNYNTFTDLVEENDRSLVLGFRLGNLDYLLMGDATKKVEKRIMERYPALSCDILKVGHHGSETSTSNEFIKYLNPQHAVISCGKNNYFGHPAKNVLTILKTNQVQIRRTDLEGTITFRMMFV